MLVSRGPVWRRTSLLTSLVVILATMLVGGDSGVAARAQSSDDLRAQQQQLEAELEQARGQQAGIAEELQGAASVREEVEGSLAEVTARVGQILADIEAVEDRKAGLESEVGELSVDAQRTRDSLGAQIRSLYMQGAADNFVVALNAQAAVDVGIRSHYLEALSRTDRIQLEVLGNITTTLQARRDDLVRVTDDLGDLRAEAQEAQSELDRELFIAAGVEAGVAQQLADAEGEARRLATEASNAAAAADAAQAREQEAARAAAAEAARRAEEAAAASAAAARAATASLASNSNSNSSDTAAESADRPNAAAPVTGSAPAAAAPVSSGNKACPQDNPRSFTDTWGASRSGGRSHQGTDIFGSRGGNVFAITSGVVQFTRNSGISGNFLSLRGDDGATYYYIHLQDFVASAGQRVSVGELIAHNGDTGNARGTTPHIHFEVHPGGGGAVNPYPLLRSICG